MTSQEAETVLQPGLPFSALHCSLSSLYVGELAISGALSIEPLLDILTDKFAETAILSHNPSFLCFPDLDVKVPHWLGKVTGRLKLLTVQYFFPQSLSSCTVQITVSGTSQMHDTDRPVVLTDKEGSVTDRPLA